MVAGVEPLYAEYLDPERSYEVRGGPHMFSLGRGTQRTVVPRQLPCDGPERYTCPTRHTHVTSTSHTSGTAG